MEPVEKNGAAGGSHLVSCLVFPSAVLFVCVLITHLRVGMVPRCVPSHHQLQVFHRECALFWRGTVGVWSLKPKQ